MVERYLSQITLSKAEEIVTSVKPKYASITLPLENSVGQITASSIFAGYSVPETSLSAMDGFAVSSADTLLAEDQKPVSLKNILRVNTGNVIPPEFDAVIRVEDVWFENDEEIIIRKPVSPGVNVRKPGEDIKKGQMILPKGSLIRSFDIGALASYGVTHILVKTIRIGIIPTGTELVPLGEKPAPGQVVESNTIMAAAYLEEFGVFVTRYPPVVDNPVLIRGALEKAADENEVVIISAGSSAGTKDFTAQVIRELGTLLFHGVAMKPAKPAMFGMIQETPVFGLPGYPLSAQTVLRVLVAPLLEKWGFTRRQAEETVKVRLADTISSEGGIDEFSLHVAGKIRDEYVALPLSRGSSVQMTGVKSNVIIRTPFGTEGYESGEIVKAVLRSSKSSLDTTVLIAGVYDPLLDSLSEKALKHGYYLRLGSTSSIQGAVFMLQNACHALCIAGETGPERTLIENSGKKWDAKLIGNSADGENLYLIWWDEMKNEERLTALLQMI